MAAFDWVRQSLDVLRAHYGLIGDVPNPKPQPRPFISAFSQALPTSDVRELCRLAPLLIINFWDDFYLIKATADENRGRLRFLGAVATFCMDFDEKWMPWPIRLREKLSKLEAGLAQYSMEGDPFNDEILPGSATPCFFRAHKFTVDWELVRFWKGWTACMDHNRDLLHLFYQINSAMPAWTMDERTERRLTDAMELPFEERIDELKRLVQEQNDRASDIPIDPEELPPF